MTTDLFTRYAALDPVDSLDTIPDPKALDAVLLAKIDGSSQNMRTQEKLTGQNNPHPRRRGLLIAVAAFAVVVLVGLGVGLLATAGDDTPPVTNPPVTTTTPETTTSTTVVDAFLGEVHVTSSSFGFDGIPAVVKAGSNLSYTNASTDEVHSMMVIRLSAIDERSVEDIVQLGIFEIIDEEGNQRFGALQALMALAPGESTSEVATSTSGPLLGSATLTKPGRYIVLCFSAVGAPMEDYQLDPLHPPGADMYDGTTAHYQEGEYAEFEVVP